MQSKFFKHPLCFLAFGFGSGLSTFMPGTCGTLVGVLFFLFLHFFSLKLYLVILFIMIFAGFFICGVAEKKTGISDDSRIVWDEIVGFLLTMVLIPFSWETVVMGFVFFRLFDILKPYPAGWINKNIHKGVGIVLDDLVAGVYAGILLQFYWL